MNAGGGEAADQLVRMMLTGGEVTVRLGGDALKNLLALTMALAKNHKKLYGKVNMRKMLNETRDVRVFTMTPEQYKQFHKLAGKQKILFSAIKDADGHGLVDVVFPVTEIERANMIFERIKYHGKPEHPQQPEQTDQPEQPEQSEQSDQLEQAGQPEQPEQPEQSDQPEQSQQPEQVEPSEQRRPESVTPEGRDAGQELQNPSSPEQPEKTASETKDESRSRLGSPDTRASFDTPRDEGTSKTTTSNRSEKRNRPSVEGRLRTYQAQIQRKASAPARRKTKFKIRMKNRSNRR